MIKVNLLLAGLFLSFTTASVFGDEGDLQKAMVNPRIGTIAEFHHSDFLFNPADPKLKYFYDESTITDSQNAKYIGLKVY
jgi:hypothetical protein